jgi:drug/metabolite transporter (DMT)-like permease
VGQVTTARFVVQGALMLPVVLWLGHGLGLARDLIPLVALRALMLILSTYSFVSAIAVMPVADALAIAFVEPFIVLILGALLHGDRVGPRRIGASVVGFGGALLVIQPSLANFGLVALWPLATAVTFALYMLVTRGLSARMDPVPMQFHTATFATVICLPVMVLANGTGNPTLDPVWPTGIAWAWLFGVGAASALAHMFVTYALRFAPSATLAPLHYLEIISAVALGYLVFGDFPDLLTWAGIIVITASGLYIIQRERLTSGAALTGAQTV